MRLLALLLIGLLLVACSDESSGDTGEKRKSAASPSPSATGPDFSRSTEPNGPPPTGGPPVLARWFDRDFSGGDLRLGTVRERTPAFVSRDVTYRSEELTISGVLNVPRGKGPFPAVVLAHGYIDPDIYVRGQGMSRERAVLAERGFIALHVDYRGHAESDDDARLVATNRFGYAVDVINAVHALRAADLPVDDDRIALFGRSMGGGVITQALEMAPGLVGAGVAFASVSSQEADNYRRFRGDGTSFWAEVESRFGSPSANPGAYRDASTAPHLDRITEPVLLVHGRADDTCPPRWASRTHDRMRRAGVDVRLRWYDDGHAFGPQFGPAMGQIVRFLESSLG